MMYEQRLAATMKRLRQTGASVSLHRLGWYKHGLRVRGNGDHTRSISIIVPIVHHWFPDACITAASFSPPYASEPQMDLIIELEK